MATASSISVSVVIPCYQAVETIAMAVESALHEQTVREVIVVDDGSEDDSVPMARSLGPKVRVLTGPNRGACHARNRGIEAATGDYLLFLDADDRVEPGFIDMLAAAVISAEADLAVGGHRGLAHDGSSVEVVDYSPGIDSMELLREYLKRSVQTAAILWRRSWLIDGGQWDETLPVYQDIEYAIRMLLRGPIITTIRADCYAIYQEHDSPTRITNTMSQKKAEAMLRVLADAANALRAVGYVDALEGIGSRAYGIAQRCYRNRLDHIGDHALSMARSFGVTGHPGSTLHRIGSSLIGLKYKTRLAGKVARIFASISQRNRN